MLDLITIIPTIDTSLFTLFGTLTAALSELPDATRFALMDRTPALFAAVEYVAEQQGCTYFEDGTVSCQ